MAAAAKGPRRRTPAPRKGDVREQAILDAAERLLEERGYDAMTVEEIATGAGLSRGSLYFYFGSKPEVLTALVARTVARLGEGAPAAAADVDSPPVEVIRAAIDRTEAAWREHGRVMRAAVDLSAVVPEIGERWTATVERFVEAMTGVLERAGLPDDGSPTGARALAQALCWMTERAFHRACAQDASPAELRAVGQTCAAVWERVLAQSG